MESLIHHLMALPRGPHPPTPDAYRSAVNRERSSRTHFAPNVGNTGKLAGRLVQALEEAGLRENTVILFTGDNGTGGDGKSTATEKGARVPLIVSGPGHVKPRGPSPRWRTPRMCFRR